MVQAAACRRAVKPALYLDQRCNVAALTGVLNPAVAPHHTHSLWRNLLLVGGTTIPVALLTEEGFFRGWLWASLRRANQGTIAILILTSIASALWHWSSVVLPTGFNPPMSQVPVFMLNAAVLGAIWGMLRLLSGSLIVASVSHGVWNGLPTCSLVLGLTSGRSASRIPPSMVRRSESLDCC